MKCFWCYRIYEEGGIGFTQIRDAEIVYDGISQCLKHLDLVRRFGAGDVIGKAMMLP